MFSPTYLRHNIGHGVGVFVLCAHRALLLRQVHPDRTDFYPFPKWPKMESETCWPRELH